MASAKRRARDLHDRMDAIAELLAHFGERLEELEGGVAERVHVQPDVRPAKAAGRKATTD